MWDRLESERIYMTREHLYVGEHETEYPVVLPVGFWKRRDETLPRGEAFLKGMHLYDYEGVPAEFWANSSNCFHGHTNTTWILYPRWLKYMVSHEPTGW